MHNICFAEYPVYTMSSLNISHKTTYKFVKESEEHEVAMVASKKCNFVRWIKRWFKSLQPATAAELTFGSCYFNKTCKNLLMSCCVCSIEAFCCFPPGGTVGSSCARLGPVPQLHLLRCWDFFLLTWQVLECLTWGPGQHPYSMLT